MTSSLVMQWHLVCCSLQVCLLFRKRSNDKVRASYFFLLISASKRSCLKDLFPNEGKPVDGGYPHTPGVKGCGVYVFLPAKGRYFHSRKGKLALRLPDLRCGQVEGFSVDAIHPVTLLNATETHQTLQDTHIRHTYTGKHKLEGKKKEQERRLLTE